MQNRKCTKTRLWSVLKDPDKHLPVLTDIATRTDRIVTRSLLFLKLILLSYPDTEVTRNFVTLVMDVVSYQSSSRERSDAQQEMLKQLQHFYDIEFFPQLPPDDEPPCRDGLHNVLGYAADRIVTDHETNIKVNYRTYVQDLVNHYYNKWEVLVLLDTNREQWNAFLRKITRDVLIVSPDREAQWKSPPEYFEDIRYLQKRLFPDEVEITEVSFGLDLLKHPQRYFPLMLEISLICSRDPKYKARNVVPLRLSVAPRYFRLDLSSAIALLMPTKRQRSASDLARNLPGKRELLKLCSAAADIVWPYLLEMDQELFRKPGFRFAGAIETDGVGVSVCFELETLKKRKYRNATQETIETAVASKEKKKTAVKTTKKPVKNCSNPCNSGGSILTAKDLEGYIGGLPDETRAMFATRKVVGIDPGMSDLLYCVSETSTVNHQEKLRYTQSQRRKETGSTKYAKILQDEKYWEIVDGNNVEEWETELSQCTRHGHKALTAETFQVYLRQKLLFNQKMASFYADEYHRKFRFNRYCNTQRSEAQFINRFRSKFGPPATTLVCLGNWSQNNHRRFHQPVKGKGFRDMFRRAGYDVVLVDEFRTSCTCSTCQIPTAKCKEVQLPFERRSPQQPHRTRIHGLLQCSHCERKWNRDTNAAINIARAARAELNGVARPLYLCKQPRAIANPAVAAPPLALPASNRWIALPATTLPAVIIAEGAPAETNRLGYP